jgi:hypothetical protein
MIFWAATRTLLRFMPVLTLTKGRLHTGGSPLEVRGQPEKSC